MINLKIENGKHKINARGNNVTILQEMLDINKLMFDKFVFRKELNIPEKDKYEIIDAYVTAIKGELEQVASFGKG